MDHTYGNVDYELSKRSGREKRPGSDESDRADPSVRGRNPPPSRETLKFLLAALGFLLLCSLVALCVLGFLYSNKRLAFEALSEQYGRVEERLSVQRNSYTETGRKFEDLKVKIKRVHEAFSSCHGCQNCSLCEEGWKSLGVKCYYFFTEKLNWMKSRDRCVEKGGHLVIITSEAEQIFLDSSIEEYETHWIGMNDLETEGKWMWVNNQTLNETGVEYWVKRQNEPDEPDNWKHVDPAGENCGGMWGRLKTLNTWFDSSCQDRRKFICEK